MSLGLKFEISKAQSRACGGLFLLPVDVDVERSVTSPAQHLPATMFSAMILSSESISQPTVKRLLL